MEEIPIDEIGKLRRHLAELADRSDDELQVYELVSPPAPPGLYWKARWIVGLTLRWLESVGLKRPDPWPVALRHVGTSARAKPLLIWAVGANRHSLRSACTRFADLERELPGHSVVLVTDVPDFSYYSRLACMVEYLPKLSGEGRPYDERKASYLARLYRDAPILPVAVLLDDHMKPAEMGRWLGRSG